MRITRTVETVEFNGSADDLADLPSDVRRRLLGEGPAVGETDQVTLLEPDAHEGRRYTALKKWTEIDDEFLAYLERRNPDEEERDLIRQFAEHVLELGDTYIEVGSTSEDSPDGLVDKFRVMKHRSRYGAGAALRPQTCRVDFRLDESHIEGREHARARDVRDIEKYRISLDVTSEEAVAEAVELTREAFEVMESA